ncbi:helix-turn-helix domain-containing protein [Nocardioides terrisoli]|uniref:helix-turn-helix domain-containing protein n=1 Tax=Nocardioides terrisoli TaxID=3388267 RepID=UPI00287B627B|nr:helix-turn-helix domain-containing protein [Nocardioides marmorisolisilvae]
MTVDGPIRRAREDRGRSLRSVAAELALSPATLSAIETGRTSVTVDRLARIAAVLGVPTSSLLEVDDHPVRRPHPTTRPRVAPSAPTSWREFPDLKLDPVLASAIRVFVTTGYHGATIRSIAAGAGTSVSGVYQRYDGKQHLLVTILDLTMDELDWRLAAARASAPDGPAGPLVRFATLVEALALFHTRRADLAFIGASEMRSIRPADHDRIARRRSEIQRMLDREIRAAVRSGLVATRRPREDGRAIATMCTSLPQWFDNAGSTTPEQIAHEYALLALRMLGTRTG